MFDIGDNLPKNLRPSNNNTINPFGARRLAWIFYFFQSFLTAGCAGPSDGQPAVRFNLAADPRTLNPLFIAPDAALVELQAARLSFEPFIDLDPHGRPEPVL
ncbi:MAG TPA: hypothetical protein VKE42_11985, partial [Candidatus Cybelea sp.]|nr:hypothetical protein [Candidatus Cybelea sp.]